MPQRMCIERPRDWDGYINPLLFAYREKNPWRVRDFSRFIQFTVTKLEDLWVSMESYGQEKSKIRT